MAHNIESHSSIRLNRIPNGSTVLLLDNLKGVSENKPGIIARLIGWEIDGKEVPAPAVIKSAPQNIQMRLYVLPTDANPNGSDLVLTKDPDGYGAMFRTEISTSTAKDPNGGDMEVESKKLIRVTAYATYEVFEARKAALAQAPETETPEAVEVTAPEPKAKPKRAKGQKAAKVEEVAA